MSSYLISTDAPSASNAALAFSASSLETPAFTVVGAPSTASFASFKPRPVNSLTTLITLIFDEPAEVRTTSNSVCSSATGAAPPAAAPATATGAAADTPNSSSIALTN